MCTAVVSIYLFLFHKAIDSMASYPGLIIHLLSYLTPIAYSCHDISVGNIYMIPIGGAKKPSQSSLRLDSFTVKFDRKAG